MHIFCNFQGTQCQSYYSIRKKRYDKHQKWFEVNIELSQSYVYNNQDESKEVNNNINNNNSKR